LWSTLLGTACAAENPTLVGSNCLEPNNCVVQQQALLIDSVDILLVIDNSASVAPKVKDLKAQLPRMLTAITSGQDGAVSFPPARSVHVAVTTADMGVGTADGSPFCSKLGGDGVFVKPGDVGVTCDVSYPGYLAFEGAGAPLSVADSVACLPLVFPEKSTTIHPPGAATPVDAITPVLTYGCGYEQPLEAALKSLVPGDDPGVTFNAGHGHGDSENAGFLRDNSLLIVVVITDEDDCSAADDSIFNTRQQGGEYSTEPVNLRCFLHQDKLQASQRYIENLKNLRPHNDNVIFSVIGGVPVNLVSDDFRAGYDFSVPAGADKYFADVLANSAMQQAPAPGFEGDSAVLGHLSSSCTLSADDVDPEGNDQGAQPPRRLVEVARGFGAQGILGSICARDFGATTGQIIRAVGEKLGARAKSAN
jgi:hypothetical protein